MMRPDEIPAGFFETVKTMKSKAHAIKINRWGVSAALTGGMGQDTTAPPGQEYLQTVDADLAQRDRAREPSEAAAEDRGLERRRGRHGRRGARHATRRATRRGPARRRQRRRTA